MNEEKGKKSYEMLSRDFKKIREQLDIEIVLQHYGYSLSTSTGNNKLYRIYKPSTPGSSQRIVVMNKADQLFKGFVDLSDTTHKGDSIQFIHIQEQEDWRRTFYIIDSLLGNTQYSYWKSQLPELVATSETLYLDDEKIIQTELIKQYQVSIVTTAKQCDYLIKKRKLKPEFLLSNQFLGRILQVNSLHKKQYRTIYNTAFPLMTERENMVSMDIRGDGYKAFPEGSKGGGLWFSNPLVELKQDTIVRSKEGNEISLSSRKKLYFSKIGVLINHQLYKLEEDNIHYLQPSHILLTESPIDAISFHQLYPPSTKEDRLYISPCGNPSKEQNKHLAKVLEKNAHAAIYLAYDADAAGVRYAINTMGIDVIIPFAMSMHYTEFTNEVREKVFFNRLVITTDQNNADKVMAMKSILKNKNKIVLQEESAEQITYSIENDMDLLCWVLQQLIDGVNNNLGRERYLNFLPIGKEKDYNAILKKQLQGVRKTDKLL